MWVMLCLNLIKIACICNYTYRIGGVLRGRDPQRPHGASALQNMTHATTHATAHTIAHAKPRRRRAAASWIDLDSRDHDPHDPQQHMRARSPHDPRLTGMQLGGRSPHDPQAASLAPCCSAAYLPGQWLPGQWLPGQWLPGQWLPGQWLLGHAPAGRRGG